MLNNEKLNQSIKMIRITQSIAILKSSLKIKDKMKDAIEYTTSNVKYNPFTKHVIELYRFVDESTNEEVEELINNLELNPFDINPYIDRYTCECGNLKGKLNENNICEKCNTEVVFKDICQPQRLDSIIDRSHAGRQGPIILITFE